MVYIVIHTGNVSDNGDTPKLEILHLKLQNFSEKCENIKSAYFIP